MVDVESTSDVPDFTSAIHRSSNDDQQLSALQPNNDDGDDDDDNDVDDNIQLMGDAGDDGGGGDSNASSSQMETTASLAQVKEKFRMGCECKTSCFKGLKAEAVYRHRLNVTELTREEHDMYLMGVTMACLSNPMQTSRNKERQRQRATYVYQGKRVCIDAFTYLENVTTYHLRRIRRHILTQGVVPRVHGNMGKKPHNTFSLAMYKCAENFIKQMLARKQSATETATTTTTAKPFILTGETRSSVYQKFKECAQHPDGKVMGYTTFGHFVKKQFPNLKFVKEQAATVTAAASMAATAAATTTVTTKRAQLRKHANTNRTAVKKQIFEAKKKGFVGEVKQEPMENDFVVVDG